MTWGHDNLGNPYTFRQRRAVQWAKFCVWFEKKFGVDLWGYELKNWRAEICDWLKYRRFDRQMLGRHPDQELWIFRNETVEVLPRPKDFLELLVVVGLAESRSDASRLVKQNSIQQREWYAETWWAPTRAWVKGYPQWIRKGKAMYGIVTYMLPFANQTEGTWLELMYKPVEQKGKR